MIDGADSTLDAIEREPVEPKKNRPLKEIVLNNVRFIIISSIIRPTPYIHHTPFAIMSFSSYF